MIFGTVRGVLLLLTCNSISQLWFILGTFKLKYTKLFKYCLARVTPYNIREVYIFEHGNLWKMLVC